MPFSPLGGGKITGKNRSTVGSAGTFVISKIYANSKQVRNPEVTKKKKNNQTAKTDLLYSNIKFRVSYILDI